MSNQLAESLGKLEPSVRQHLKNVYISLAACTLTAAVGSYINLYTKALHNRFLLEVGSLLLLLLLLFSQDPENKQWQLRLGYLLGFSLLRGAEMGPLLAYFVVVDPSSIVTAILGTALIFVALTMIVMVSERGHWLMLGGMLLNMLMLMLFLALVNVFIMSSQLIQVNLYIGLLLMCLLVLYDTTLVMERCREGNLDFVTDALALFIDLIGIFVRLLITMLQRNVEGREGTNSE